MKRPSFVVPHILGPRYLRMYIGLHILLNGAALVGAIAKAILGAFLLLVLCGTYFTNHPVAKQQWNAEVPN
jgi:hypothetical protein